MNWTIVNFYFINQHYKTLLNIKTSWITMYGLCWDEHILQSNIIYWHTLAIQPYIKEKVCVYKIKEEMEKEFLSSLSSHDIQLTLYNFIGCYWYDLWLYNLYSILLLFILTYPKCLFFCWCDANCRWHLNARSQTLHVRLSSIWEWRRQERERKDDKNVYWRLTTMWK